ITWRVGKYPAPVFGFTSKGLKWEPYLLMLLIMIPLIAWASTQADFLRTYPKMKVLSFLGEDRKAWQNLLYEFTYGMDFITIEWFFRGFLVLAFVRYAGQEAILPMAVFYCSIHFGKPLMECVSSLFGGMLLGVVVYRTGSIAGGLVVHLGIAWMMEAGGYIGRMMAKN
ncbi:MAG: CPBP family intramembrane glutamic endopeptidase, partial [Chitinophagaceae bacterium]